ncbi:MAG TPA: zf-HC2 domain-containing protein [Longimicrobiales bacterium]
MDGTHRWMDRLSEYLDGELDAADRAALEAHLQGCAECAVALDELRAVIALAGSLEDRPPASDLWPGIARRIAAERPAARVAELAERRREAVTRISFSLPRLAAAAIALMLLSGGSVWLAMSGRAPAPAAPVAETTTPGAGDRAVRLATDRAVPGYDRAVSDLARILEEGRDRLDPATIEVLETNLRIIDRAIEEARRAVAQDPMNVYLNRHLAESMQRKLQFLRQAGEIVRAQT